MAHRLDNPQRLHPASISAIAALAVIIGMGGCTLAPRAAVDERKLMHEAGVPGQYATPFQQRELPEFPSAATWRDVLHRAFLANGDLEAAHARWRTAVERIDVAAAYPNTNITLGYSYMFSSERMTAFDRSTFSAGFDSMENLAYPGKTIQAGRVAFDEARAEGERFRQSKFDLQRRVLIQWTQYGLVSQQAIIRERDVELLRYLTDTAVARVRSGKPVSELSRAQVALREAENALRNLEAERAGMRAMLNGMLARAPDEPLSPPTTIELRPVWADDAALLAAAVDQNPELAALAREVEGRADALELARLAWIPDINPSAMFTGAISQAIGAAIVLPTTIPKIRGTIAASQAELRASEAMLRQGRRDRAASFVATLVAFRNAERQVRLYEDEIIPLAEQTIASTKAAYGASRADLVEFVDAQRVILEARMTLADAKAAREVRLAELEALAGVDVETIGQPASPTTPSSTTKAMNRDSQE